MLPGWEIGMARIWQFFNGPGGMVRRHLAMAAGIGILTLGLAHGLIRFIETSVEPEPARIAAGQTRNFTVTRSVLDDNLATGSIPRPKGARIDPCRE